MSEDHRRGAGLPQEQPMGSDRKSLFQSTAERIERTAQVRLEKIDNQYREQRVIGQQLVGAFKAAEAEAQLQHDRLENIEEEKATQRQAVRTKREELETRAKEAVAAADDIIGQHIQNTEEHAAAAAEARARRLEAEIRERGLQAKLDAMAANSDTEGQRNRLAKMETELQMQLIGIDEELQALLMMDGDQANLQRRAKQAERIGVEQRLRTISNKLLELDGLL